MAYWHVLSLYLCAYIYLYVNIVRFLRRTKDLTESFSEVPSYVGNIFPHGPDVPGINDSYSSRISYAGGTLCKYI